MSTVFVGYYRVSTAAQGRSGLGLDAQREAVSKYVESVGGTLAKEFHEVESGGLADRPQLQAALRYCRLKKAMLVIAKLDRLARNVHFITQLMESSVDFIAADMPTASKLTIHIIAAMAEYERDVISQRTKVSLKAAKARGVILGNPRISEISARGTDATKRQADAFALKILPTIETMRARGIRSYSQLALVLDAEGVKSARGGRWSAASVKNLLVRAEEIKARSLVTACSD